MNTATHTHTGAENMDDKKDNLEAAIANHWEDTRDEYKAQLRQLKAARLAKMDASELADYYLRLRYPMPAGC